MRVTGAQGVPLAQTASGLQSTGAQVGPGGHWLCSQPLSACSQGSWGGLFANWAPSQPLCPRGQVRAGSVHGQSSRWPRWTLCWCSCLAFCRAQGACQHVERGLWGSGCCSLPNPATERQQPPEGSPSAPPGAWLFSAAPAGSGPAAPGGCPCLDQGTAWDCCSPPPSARGRSAVFSLAKLVSPLGEGRGLPSVASHHLPRSSP